MLGKIVLLALAASLVACSDSNSNPASKTGREVTTDLSSILNKKLTTTPVVTLLFHRADHSNLEGAEVSLYETKHDKHKVIAASDTTDSDGKVSFAVPAGNYQLFVNGMDEISSSLVHDLVDYRDELQVTATNTQFFEYSAERHTFAIDAPAGIVGSLFIAQFDNNGFVYSLFDDKGFFDAYDPYIVSNDNLITHTVEMFPGNYFAILNGSSQDAGIKYAATKTQLFTTTGSSTKTSELKLQDSGIVVTIKLLDPSGNGLANYSIIAHEHSYSNILQNDMLGITRSQSDSDGVAPLLLSEAMNITAVIRDMDNKLVAVHEFGMISSDMNATLQQHVVSGVILPPLGAKPAIDENTRVEIRVVDPYTSEERDAYGSIKSVLLQPAADTGAYSANLFSGSYLITAVSVENFSSTSPLSVDVGNNNLEAQNLSVNPLGVIRGTVLTQSNAPVSGVNLTIYRSDEPGAPFDRLVALGQTDENGGYEVKVPYGTYGISADGALRDNIVVDAAHRDVEVNRTQYRLAGRVTDDAGVSVTAQVVVSYGDYASTNALGVYTINVVDGRNELCFYPENRPEFSTECVDNILFNEDTVAAYRKQLQ